MGMGGPKVLQPASRGATGYSLLLTDAPSFSFSPVIVMITVITLISEISVLSKKVTSANVSLVKKSKWQEDKKIISIMIKVCVSDEILSSLNRYSDFETT